MACMITCYLPPRRRPGTGDNETPPSVCPSVCPSGTFSFQELKKSHFMFYSRRMLFSSIFRLNLLAGDLGRPTYCLVILASKIVYELEIM